MKIETPILKEFILDLGLISKSDLESIEKKSESLENGLLNSGRLSEDELRRIQANILGIPFVNLTNEKIDFDVISIIPEPITRNFNIVAYKKDGDIIEVAVLDLGSLEEINFLKQKCKILPRLTSTKSIKNALLQYQKHLKEKFGKEIQKQSQALKEDLGDFSLVELVKYLPVVYITDILLQHAVSQNASDIHIEQAKDRLLVRYRIEGKLHDAMILPKKASLGIMTRLKFLSSLNLNKKDFQKGEFVKEIENEEFRFSTVFAPMINGEKVVVNIFSNSNLELLGFSDDDSEKIHRELKNKKGVILVAGSEKSGKTTTLYTLLGILNKPSVNISTIEKNIEYQMNRVNQMKTNEEIGFSFTDGIRTAIKQDSDIIMVSDLEDKETGEMIFNSVLSESLLLSSVDADSSIDVVSKLTKMKINSSLVVSNLNMVIFQKIVSRLSVENKKYFLSKSEIEKIKKYIDLDRMLKNVGINEKVSWSKIPFYKNIEDNPFEKIGLFEVWKISPSVREMISNEEKESKILEQVKKEGMNTIIEDGVIKAIKGIVPIDEVLKLVK
jgi:type II secretory ATPase GspE/PulE/Tfp pilus assembly ATPase PilB-like protein